jgi:hypothetical protein
MTAARKFILAALLSLVAFGNVQATEMRPVAKAEKLTPASLPEHLKKLGYKVEVVPTEIGAPICLVSLEKDGWSFVIEVAVNAQGALNLVAPLVAVPLDKTGSPKFLQILEANDAIGPCSFCYRSADNKICMRLQVTDTSETGLADGFAVLTEKIRLTYSIWGQGTW